MGNRCKCKNGSCASTPTSSIVTETASTASTSCVSSNGERRHTSLYNVIMTYMTETNERDHFYQFPMSYSYQ
uniref:AC4 n=1 Tax=Panagrellus redivivus TaxID=6233 RepID=A0A7E4UZW9_PANRE